MRRRVGLLFALTLLIIASGFFWFVKASVSVELPSEKNPIVIYSNQSLDHLKHITLSAIVQAKESITIHSFALTDQTLWGLLLKKSKEGVAIEVITDPKTSPLDMLTSVSSIQWWAPKTSGLIHDKILIIDRKLLFLGTANMTIESLTMHENMMLGIYSPSIAAHLQEQSLQKRFKGAKLAPIATTHIVGEQALSTWFFPSKKSEALDELLHDISRAQQEIIIAMFTFTHPRLQEALIAAKERGIDVKVYLDKNSSRGASKKVLELLQAANIPVFCGGGVQLLHHKFALIDRHTLFMGSANWTKAAFQKNSDFLLRLTPLNEIQLKVLGKISKALDRESTPAEPLVCR